MKPLRIMVLEDEALIAMLLGELLAGLGHSICATEGTEAGAVAAALLWQPDLMIVDGRLQGGDGVTAVRRILLTRFIPHVFVTGDPASIRLSRPDAIILQKPFFEPELVRAIRLAMDVGTAPLPPPGRPVSADRTESP